MPTLGQVGRTRAGFDRAEDRSAGVRPDDPVDLLGVVGTPMVHQNPPATIHHANLYAVLVVVQTDKNATIIHARCSCVRWASLEHAR
jgi:hypothetical protein